MGLSVKVDLEAYPQGIPLGIVGIGVVENGGEALEIDPVMEEVFFSMNNNTIENVLKDQEGMDVSGSAEYETPEGWEPPPEPEQLPTEGTTEEPVVEARASKKQQQTTPEPDPTPPTEGGES